MGHVFISYSHKDKKYVEKLEKKLISEGFEVWIDHHIDYGSQWSKEIQRALDTCDAFVVVVSENAYKSKWVQNEVARADRKKKPFFPLLLQGEAWLVIEAFQYVDVKNGALPPEKFYRRLATVTVRKKKTMLVPPVPIREKPVAQKKLKVIKTARREEIKVSPKMIYILIKQFCFAHGYYLWVTFSGSFLRAHTYAKNNCYKNTYP
ncbi:MAG: toll/interleukin-1 receptor domain-containing protein [Chloroflexi bacterium]|nr:toll/interleukin-1 receptor domain-containing protein [Chloroflexota bacterium]